MYPRFQNCLAFRRAPRNREMMLWDDARIHREIWAAPPVRHIHVSSRYRDCRQPPRRGKRDGKGPILWPSVPRNIEKSRLLESAALFVRSPSSLGPQRAGSGRCYFRLSASQIAWRKGPDIRPRTEPVLLCMSRQSNACAQLWLPEDLFPLLPR